LNAALSAGSTDFRSRLFQLTFREALINVAVRP
jgi:hypothetical protein